MQTYVPEICMVGAKVIQFSAKYFGACFELLTKCGRIKPLCRPHKIMQAILS